MKPYRRRKFFIDKRLQTKYILLTMIMLFVYTMVLVLVLFVPYIVPLELGASSAEQVNAARMLLALHKSIWPAIGVVILLMGFMTIFVSHGVAGPVYRFKKVLSEISSGNLDQTIRLRKYDDLQDLAASMNEVIGDLRGFVRTMQNNHQELNACIQLLEEKECSKEVGPVCGQTLIGKLKGNRDRIALALAKYSGE